MAELLERGLWPADKVILAYFAAAMLLELVYWQPELILIHILAIALIWIAVQFPRSQTSRIFRYWYPLPYVFACYKEMAILIPIVRTWTADVSLAQLDHRIWGANPTVWLERWQTPFTVEFFQIVYAGFVPAILIVAIILWWQNRLDEFRRYAFLIVLGFLVSYVGYIFVPARGPRFLLASLQTRALTGLWLSQTLRTTLDRLESAHYDCFPSGHTELTLLAWWGSRSISRNLSWPMFVYALGVIFATVFLRYHYTVDVLAGILVAGGLILISPRLYARLSGRTA